MIGHKPAGNEIATLRNNAASWWFRDRGLRRLAVALSVGFVSVTNIGFDGSMMSGLMANPLFMSAIDHPSPLKLALIVCGNPFGGMLGLLPAAWVSDRYGRRMSLAIGYVAIIVGSLMETFLTGGWKLMGGRFCVGFGACWSMVPGPAYTAEIAHPRNRATTTALLQSSFFLGAIIAAWVAFGALYLGNNDWSWRMCFTFQLILPLYVLATLPFLPESPRFLVARGREEEAHRVLAKYHANGDVDDELVQYELEAIKEAIAIEHAAKATGWGTFLETKGNRHRLVIVIVVGISSQWCGNGIFIHYIVPILKTVGVVEPAQQAGFNGGLQVWNWLVAIAGALVTERFGRRKAWLFSAVGMAMSYIVITACSAAYTDLERKNAGPAVLAFIFVFFGFYNAGFTPLYLSYPLEILPYSLRTKGMSVLNFAALGAGVVNALVNPVALAAIGWKYYFVFLVVLLLIIVAIVFLFPETKGLLLEDVAAIFDGEDAILPVHKLGHDKDYEGDDGEEKVQID